MAPIWLFALPAMLQMRRNILRRIEQLDELLMERG